MASLPPHIHISAMNGLIVTLYVILALAVIHIIGRRFQGHPLADTLLDIA